MKTAVFHYALSALLLLVYLPIPLTATTQADEPDLAAWLAVSIRNAFTAPVRGTGWDRIYSFRWSKNSLLSLKNSTRIPMGILQIVLYIALDERTIYRPLKTMILPIFIC